MTEKATNELIYEVLKKMQARLDRHEQILQDVHGLLVRMRDDIHNGRGDVLRLERQNAEASLRLGRIENRLELRDA